MAILNIDLSGPDTERRREYWLSLGRFIHHFAQMEQQVAFLLKLATGADDAVSKSVYSGIRLKMALDCVNRLREMRHQPESPYLKRAVEQLGVINAARDMVVHHGATVMNDLFLVSTERRMVPKKAAREAFPPETLDAMTADLRIINKLIFVVQSEYANQDLWDPDGEYAKALVEPWQYKSRKLAVHQRKTRGDFPTPATLSIPSPR